MNEANSVDLTQVDQTALDRLKEQISERKRRITEMIAEVADYSNIYQALDSVLNKKKQSGGSDSLVNLRQILTEIERAVLKASIEFTADSFTDLTENSTNSVHPIDSSNTDSALHNAETFESSSRSTLPPDALKNLEPAAALFKYLRASRPYKPTLKEIFTGLLRFGFPKSDNYEQNMEVMVRYYVKKQVISRDPERRYELTLDDTQRPVSRIESSNLIASEEKTMPTKDTRTMVIGETSERQMDEQVTTRDQKGRFIGDQGVRTVDRFAEIMKAKNIEKLHVKQLVVEFEIFFGEKRTEQQLSTCLRKSAARGDQVRCLGKNYFALLKKPDGKQFSVKKSKVNGSSIRAVPAY